MRTIALLLVLALGAPACHSKPKSRFIDEPTAPPLPPASGTPIGILIDEASALRLNHDQLQALTEIDDRLRTRNDEIDETLRAGERPVGAAGDVPRGGGRHGGRHGGRSGGGGMGGPSGGGMGGPSGGGMGGPSGPGGGGPSGGSSRGGTHGGRGPGDGSSHHPGSDSHERQQLEAERAANTRDAIARALDLLDAEQRTTATTILTDRGVDAESSPPRAAEPPLSGETQEPPPSDTE